MSYLIAAKRTWLTEWRYTYRSARREWTRGEALRMWARELIKGACDLPNHAREIRTSLRTSR
jgi:hypothetical protein